MPKLRTEVSFREGPHRHEVCLRSERQVEVMQTFRPSYVDRLVAEMLQEIEDFLNLAGSRSSDVEIKCSIEEDKKE